MDKYEFDTVTTKKGDFGKSRTYDGQALYKDHAIFEMLGELDELTSHLGVVRSVIVSDPVRGFMMMTLRVKMRHKIEEIQDILQDAMTLVATSPLSDRYEKVKKIKDEEVVIIEEWQQSILNTGVKIPPKFVAPGHNLHSAHVDVARAVCRRVERHMTRFLREQARADLIPTTVFLNRLSDALFIMGRWLEQNPPKTKLSF